MALDVLVMAFVGIFVGLGWLWRIHSSRRATVLPAELRTASLIYAERLFRFIGTVSITAKVDRVYRNTAGELVLVELKTRSVCRTYLSDVIELSAQRIAVMAQTGMSVTSHAYVVTENPMDRKRSWHRVELMEPDAVIALALRRKALLSGNVEARCAYSSGICRTCGFRRECLSS